MKKATTIIFHPKEIPFTQCAVDTIDDLLNLQSSENMVVVRTDDSLLHLSAVFNDNSQPDGVILFTHGHPTEYKFVTKQKNVTSEWWKYDIPIGNVFAYACHSALVLSQPEWENIFGDWVASTGTLRYSTDEESQKYWKELFNLIIENYNPEKSGEETLKQFQNYSYLMVKKCIGNPALDLFRTLVIDNLEFLTCKRIYNN